MKLKDTIHDKLPQKLLILVIILFLFFMSAQAINSSWSDVFSDQSYLVNFLNGFARPDFAYIPDLLVPILETLAMSLAGTFFGVILAIPAAFLGTEIVTKNKLVTFIFRAFFSLVRTIPNLLLGGNLCNHHWDWIFHWGCNHHHLYLWGCLPVALRSNRKH